MKLIFSVKCGIVFLALIYSLIGCSDQDTLKAQVKIAELEGQVITLTAANDALNRKLEVLASDHLVLSKSYLELGEWADGVVSTFGQGIWYPEDLVFPYFSESMKDKGLDLIIDTLNERFRKDKLPEVIYLEQKGRTVFVGVSDDQKLTRELGSFGANAYLNAVVFSLASLDDISCVTFKFEEGDHAIPGTYCRTFIKK